ncbi:HEAT repeat-containing protein 6 [Rhodotorula toruloides]|nr:HEAT repeat-containing protein 6 [Rhodotorula toruloides]
MSALERADAVLQLSSVAENTLRQGHLPCPPSELARLWCGRLAEEICPGDEKETLLRALRCCRFTMAHDIVISTCQPLLLEISSSLRLHAASCLLQYISTSTGTLVTDKTPSLVATIVRALAPLPHQLPSASSALHRFVSTSFRIISVCIGKTSTLSSDVVTSVAQLVGGWIYQGLQPVAGAVSPLATARGRVAGQGQLAFGVMSAFMQPTPSPRKRKNSAAANASSRASSVSRLGDSSDSEDEAGRTFDRRRYLAQIRLDALSCLRALANASPRALHKHWSLFLADSPYLRDRHTLFSIIESDPSHSNRLQACSALEALLAHSAAYLNIAEDRSTKASFTSLSAKLGETLGELHSSLASLLSRPVVANQADVHLALLSFAAVLAANSPYGRLKKPLAWQLAKSCLPHLSSTNTKVVAAAANALTSIVSRYLAMASTASFEWEQLLRAVEPLLAGDVGEDSRAAGWSLLAAIIPGVSSGDWMFATQLFEAGFAPSSITVQEAQARFIVALARSPSTSSTPDLQRFVDLALASPHDTVRAIACTALTSPRLASLSASSDFKTSPWRTACLLAAQDPSTDVRAAAIRVLGLLVKSDGPAAPTPASVQETIPTLLSAVDDGVRELSEGGGERVNGAMWTLANCCDVFTQIVLDPDVCDNVLEAILGVLERDTTGEQAIISAYRILGSLSGGSAANITRSEQLFDRAAKAAVAGLAHPAAKVRWNASIAATALLPRIQDDSLSKALFDAVIGDSSFKVRIHASTALLSPAVSPGRFPPDALSRLRPSLDRLVAELEDGRVPPKEKQHAEQLVKRLTSLCARLMTT